MSPLPRALASGISLLLFSLWAESAYGEVGRLRIGTAGELKCPTERAIEKALHRQLDVSIEWVDGLPPDSRAVLIRQRSKNELFLELYEGGKLASKRPIAVVPTECDEIAQSLAIIIDGWFLSLPVTTRRELIREGSLTTTDAGQPPQAAPILDPSPEPEDAGFVNAPAIEGEVGPAPANAPTFSTEHERPQPFHLRASLVGGGNFDLGEAGQPLGVLETDLEHRSGFGAALRLQLDANRQKTLGPGKMSASLQGLSFLALGSLRPIGPSEIIVATGIQFDHLWVHSQGYSQNRQLSLLGLGMLALAEWRIPILEPFFAEVALGANYRFREEKFEIENVAGSFRIPHWGISGGVGLGFTAF